MKLMCFNLELSDEFDELCDSRNCDGNAPQDHLEKNVCVSC